MQDLETEILDKNLQKKVAEKQKSIYDRMFKSSKAIKNRDEESEERSATKSREIIRQELPSADIENVGSDTRDLSKDYTTDLKEDFPILTKLCLMNITNHSTYTEAAKMKKVLLLLLFLLLTLVPNLFSKSKFEQEAYIMYNEAISAYRMRRFTSAKIKLQELIKIRERWIFRNSQSAPSADIQRTKEYDKAIELYKEIIQRRAGLNEAQMAKRFGRLIFIHTKI